MYTLKRGVTPQEIRHLIELDLVNTNGSGIRYKNNYNSMQTIGSMAGGLTVRNKYYQVMLNGKFYLAHHIVLLLDNREGIHELRKQAKQVLVVDHINDGSYPVYSNHPNNLRITTQRHNLARVNNKQGVRLLSSGKWQARIYIEGQEHSNTLPSKQEAIEWRASLQLVRT